MKKTDLIKIIKEEIANVIEEKARMKSDPDGQDLMAYVYGYDQRMKQFPVDDGGFTDAERAAIEPPVDQQNPNDRMTGPTNARAGMQRSSEKTDQMVATIKRELEAIQPDLKSLRRAKEAGKLAPGGLNRLSQLQSRVDKLSQKIRHLKGNPLIRSM